MDDEDNGYWDEYREQEKKDTLVLEEVKKILNNDPMYKELLEYINETSSTDFNITDDYPHELSNDAEFTNGDFENSWIKEVYADSHQYGEDSWSGNIYIKLPNNKYFKYYFMI